MLLQHGFNHLRIGLHRTEEGIRAEVVRSEKCGKPDYLNPRDYPRHVDVLWAGSCDEPQVRISLCAEGQRHFFTVNGQRVAEADGSFLGSETAGGFVGAYVGCYVSGSGAEAVFADFRYQGE